MTKKPDNDVQAHPLFPPDDDDEPRQVVFISVLRHENGRMYHVPHTFRAEEIVSLEDVFSLFGGGLYELWGRGASITNPERPGWIAYKRRYEIPGPSKPLVPADPNTPTAPAPLPMMPAQAPAAPASPNTSLMGMFMQMQTMMFQTAQENARAQAEAQRRADERARADNQQMMQMIATMQGQNTQAVMGVVSAVVAGRSGGPDDLMKYMQLFQAVAGKTPAAPGDEPVGDGLIDKLVELTGNAADVVQGAVKLKEAGPMGPPAPPGSAAAVFGVPGVVKPPGTPQGQGGAPPMAP